MALANISIKNIDELRSEITRLELSQHDQTIMLKQRFSSPSAILATVMSVFPKSATIDGIRTAGFFKQDFVNLLSRLALPLALNKTLFKSSNFLVKSLVSVMSQKASNYINEDTVGVVVNRIKSIFGMGEKKQTAQPDPLIPADSETY